MDKYNQYRRLARHLKHQNNDKFIWIVIGTQKKKTNKAKYRVIQKTIYTASPIWKKNYPYIHKIL